MCSPQIANFKQIVNELLEQGIVRPRKSQYAIPGFMDQKSGTEFRGGVDYWKVNDKILFDYIQCVLLTRPSTNFQVP